MEPRSYDELKAVIRDMKVQAQNEFSKGKYWLTLKENGDGCDTFTIQDGDEEKSARAVLVCREKGKVTKIIKKGGLNGKSTGTRTTTGAINVLEIPVLEDEITCILQLMIEDGNLFIEDGDSKEEAGNIRYWRAFLAGETYIKMGYDKEADRFFVEATHLKEQTA